MIVMIVDTGSFEFIGLDNTRVEATEGLLLRWELHCKNCPDAEKGYMRELIDGGSAQVVALEPGSAVIYGHDG
ncbi:hypothetical protein [Marinobacterium aestuariivivens]|uniref:Uncharacterized protein n=1 Tax=Marinobacterium aestuariivivens TaxID=1698799 RepID=A0ABW2AA52_9GAMM